MANRFTYMYTERSYVLATFYDHPASARRLSFPAMQKRKTIHCPAWEVLSLERVAGLPKNFKIAYVVLLLDAGQFCKYRFDTDFFLQLFGAESAVTIITSSPSDLF